MLWLILTVNVILITFLIYYRLIGQMVFNVLTNIYTFLRVKYELYDPFKPQLKIVGVSYFYRLDDKINKISSSSDTIQRQINDLPKEKISIAFSYIYSFSNWNQKFIKLVDLRGSSDSHFINILLDEVPTYNDYNYDYTVSVASTLIKETDLPTAKYNLEAYLRKTSTFEAENTLKLLRDEPDLMEFIYPSLLDIKTLFENGWISFIAVDDLGSQFVIQKLIKSDI